MDNSGRKYLYIAFTNYIFICHVSLGQKTPKRPFRSSNHAATRPKVPFCLPYTVTKRKQERLSLKHILTAFPCANIALHWT